MTEGFIYGSRMGDFFFLGGGCGGEKRKAMMIKSRFKRRKKNRDECGWIGKNCDSGGGSGDGDK